MRKHPIRHEVRQYKRRTPKGKIVIVHKHKKGQGKAASKKKRVTNSSPSRSIRERDLINNFRRRTTNRDYVFGDFDKDGTPNIDDVRPYDRAEAGQVEEIKLTDELEGIEKHRKPFIGSNKKIADTLESLGYEVLHRVKTPYSIVNKLRRKHIDKLWDIGGVMILTDSEAESYKVARFIEKKYQFIDKDDYYATPRPWEDDYYKALHYIVVVDDKPHEIQIKTRQDYKKHIEWHTTYKKNS